MMCAISFLRMGRAWEGGTCPKQVIERASTR